MIVHCLFEQSGTFRDEFRKLGYEAYDYDIENQFGKTDYQIDLFKEIEKTLENKSNIFDGFTKDDLIIAFFPCVRFTSSIYLELRADGGGGEVNWTPIKKLLHSKKLNKEQSYFYSLFC